MPERNKTILLVNDNPHWLRAMTLMLEQAGYVVTPAKDGLTALNLARKERPDVVVSDVIMGMINGYELCRCIRSIDLIAQTPVILFSNLDFSPSDLKEAWKAGANAVVPGSPDLGALLKTVRELSP